MASAKDYEIGLKIGGKFYLTSRSTLTRYPDSFFTLLLEGGIPSNRDEQGNYLIDRDGEIFRHVLNFLRTGKLLHLPEGFKDTELLEREADFYMLPDLKEAIKRTLPVGLLFDDDKVFKTTRENLTRIGDSFFKRMLEGEFSVTRDMEGNYVMDRDGSLFHHILSYLRDGGLLKTINLGDLPQLQNEADYFDLDIFKSHIKTVQHMHNRRDSLPYLHFYYCVNSPSFAYTNVKYSDYNVGQVCRSFIKIADGVFAGLVDLERIGINDMENINTEGVLSYFTTKLRGRSHESSVNQLSADCIRFQFEPY